MKGVFIMAKKGLGRFVAFAAIAGAAAAGVSYALRYKTFHNELEKDFREFEDEDEDGEDLDEGQETAEEPKKLDRNYIALHASKDEFKVAAKDMAEATKNVLKDASVILSDTARDAVSAAVDTAHIAVAAVKNKKAELGESQSGGEKEAASDEDEGFLDDDYVDEDDLYDYTRMDTDDQVAWKQTEDEKEPAGEEAPAPAQTEQAEEAPKATATIEEDTI